MARRARDRRRGPFHQQRRGRDELHPVPATASRCTPSISRKWPAPTGAPISSCAPPPTASASPPWTARTGALTEDMTVIATPERAVALAGVMGGENSEVTEETTCVLLESAAFERGRTSRTSRNLGLISEASMRYERGVDDHLCEVVSQAAAAASGRGVRGHGAPRRGGRVRAAHRPSGAHLPHPALCGHDGGRHSRRLHRGHSRAPRLCRGGHRRRLRALGAAAHLPPRPGARDRPVRGSAAPVGHGPHPARRCPAAASAWARARRSRRRCA